MLQICIVALLETSRRRNGIVRGIKGNYIIWVVRVVRVVSVVGIARIIWGIVCACVRVWYLVFCSMGSCLVWYMTYTHTMRPT